MYSQKYWTPYNPERHYKFQCTPKFHLMHDQVSSYTFTMITHAVRMIYSQKKSSTVSCDVESASQW